MNLNLTRVKQATSEFIKVLRYGKDDVHTADSVTPHGIDSKPVKNALAIYAKTNSTEQAVILGILQNFEQTKEGETRIFATDANGTEVFDIFLKRNGTVELGGNADFAVRFNALDSGMQAFVTDLNAKLVTALGAVGGSWPGTSININNAKIDKIKTL